MPLAYWCVLIAALLPYVLAKYAKAGSGDDNHHPREIFAALAPHKRRAYAAHQNALETFPFFAVAVIVLLCLALTERRRRAVRARGRIVSAEVTAVRPNPAISVNGRNPSVVECVYRADDGASYLLKSDALWWDAAAKIAVGDAVPVYWDDYDKKHYSVDLSGFCAESPVDLR